MNYPLYVTKHKLIHIPVRQVNGQFFSILATEAQRGKLTLVTAHDR